MKWYGYENDMTCMSEWMNEMKFNDMKCNDMIWHEIKWNENVITWNDMHGWNGMKSNANYNERTWKWQEIK